MIKFTKKSLTILCILMMIALLNGAEKPVTWTILFYGHGDHNLSSSLADDLLKFEKVGSSASFRILGQLDFNASAEEDNVEAGLPAKLSKGVTRMLFTKSNDDENVTSKPLERLPELNMDDPKVLKEFIDWGMKKYPADRYAVILWDHGSQWEGFGGDTQDGTTDGDGALTPVQIRDAIQEAMKNNKVQKLDFLAFDTCLMGGIEVLDAFNGLCDFFFACPEIDYGSGWNYEEALGWLKRNPKASMLDFSKVEVETWQKLHMKENNTSDLVWAAHSAYDMNQYPKVREAFIKFNRTLATKVEPGNLLLPKIRRKAVEYGISSSGEEDEVLHYIDLGGFAKGVINNKEAPEVLKTDAKELIASIEQLIVAKAIGEDKFGAMGLSIWYPMPPIFSDDDEDKAEAKDTISKQFKDYCKIPLFIDSPWPVYLEKVWAAREKFDKETVISKLSKNDFKLKPNQELNFTIKVQAGPGAYLLHNALVDASFGSKTQSAYVGEALPLELNGTGSYTFSWKPQVLCVVMKNGDTIPLCAFPKDPSGELWVSYANYQASSKADPQQAIVLILVRDGKARILKLLNSDDELAPTAIRVKPGATITPLLIIEEREDDDPDNWEKEYIPFPKSFTVPPNGLEALNVRFETMPPGAYILEMEIEDVNGFRSDTTTVKVEVLGKDGKSIYADDSNN